MRQLTPYEQTHLARFGKSNIDITNYGEMPVEYITGKVEFYDHVFEITRDTLIPRIESEELIDLTRQILEEKKILPDAKSLTIADIGCGCGAIGISTSLALDHIYPDLKLELIMSDVSAPAVKVAKQNAERLLASHIKSTVLTSDLLHSIPQHQYDIMIANLPYIPSDRLSVLDTSVTEYEPHIALDGGPDGLSLIREFLMQAIPLLKPTSFILLEIDYTHTAEEIAVPGLSVSIRTVEDQFHRTRFAVITPL